jgi:hypothetical protein
VLRLLRTPKQQKRMNRTFAGLFIGAAAFGDLRKAAAGKATFEVAETGSICGRALVVLGCSAGLQRENPSALFQQVSAKSPARYHAAGLRCCASQLLVTAATSCMLSCPATSSPSAFDTSRTTRGRFSSS